MAETEYMRLSCGGCGNVFDRLRQAGRPPSKCEQCRDVFKKPARKQHSCGEPCGVAGCDQVVLSKGLCSRHYGRARAHGGPGPIHQICAQCNLGFQCERKKKFCSRRCLSEHGNRKSGAIPLDEHLATVKSKHNHFVCMHCGAEAYRKCGGSTLKAGGNKYCDRKCAADAKKQAGIPRITDSTIVKGLAGLHKHLCTLEDRAVKATKRCLCVECGTHVGEPIPRVSTRCVNCNMQKVVAAYADSLLAKRRARAKSRRKPVALARKAWAKAVRRAGVPITAHRFNPMDVLERDGWHCQVCGVHTPERLRGTYHEDAPEVDHIIPVTRGGSHTWTNVRCLCRSCNAEKKDMLDSEWAALAGRADQRHAAGEVAGVLVIPLETAPNHPLHCEPTTLTP